MTRALSVALVVTVANAALLIFQLSAGRFLAPYVGSSLATWTAVIGVFLLGISAGNWYGGRLADRRASGPVLAALLLAGAAAAVVSYGLLKWLGPTPWIRGLSLHARIAVLTMAIGFGPSFVLSLITPVSIKAVLREVSAAGRIAGRIYALGTIGSLIGNYFAGFYLMAWCTIDVVQLGTAGLLAALAPIAWLGVGRESIVPDAAAKSTPDRPASAALTPATACLIVFVASFCCMSLELAATRLLAPKVGVSLYTWTGVIGVVLAGVAAGNWYGGRVAAKSGSRETLGGWLMWSGLWCIVLLLVYGMLEVKPPRINPFTGQEDPSAAQYYDADNDGGDPHAWRRYLEFVASRLNAPARGDDLVVRILFQSCVLFLPVMFCLGTISPQVTGLAVPNVASAGRIAGLIYAVSCAGAIAGTFATGWFLIGQFGTIRLVFGLSVVLLVLACSAGQLWLKPKDLAFTGIIAASALGGLLVSDRLLERLDGWTVSRTDSNYYLIRVITGYHKDNEVRKLALDLLTHSFVRGDTKQVNGQDKWVADPSYLGYEHEQVQAEFAQAAADRHERPNVLIIGGGGYTLPRWIETYLPNARVEVVEIDPKVTEVVHDHLDLPRTTKIVSHHLDGRQFVQELAQPGGYQLIVQDAVNDLSVPSHIMTAEYNQAVRRLLTPDGVYLLTVIDEYERAQLLPAAIRTMQASFPHVRMLGASDIWSAGRGVWVISGSEQPIDLEQLRRTLEKHNVTMKTTAQPLADMKAYLDRHPSPVLTDSFAPVDNLIANTFRFRDKK